MAKLDMEKLKGKDSLTEEEEAALRDEALSEIGGEKSADPEEEPSEPEPEETGDGKKEEEQEQEQKEEEEAEPDSDKDEGKEDEEKPEEKPDESDKKDKKEEELEEQAKEYALDHNVSVEEAKEALREEKKILKKYDNDAAKLARAYYNVQVLESKAQQRIKELEESLSRPLQGKMPDVDTVINLIEEGKLKGKDGKVLDKKTLIEAFKEENADVTEFMDNDTVLRMAAKDIIKNIERSNREYSEKVKSNASDKRTSLINNLPKSVKRFEADIKKAVDETPDEFILSDNFNFSDIIAWARGLPKNLNVLLDEARKQGIKQAKESPEIEGEITPSGSTGKSHKSKKSVSISEEDKVRALNMFEGQAMTDQEKYEAFLEIRNYEKNLDKKKEKE